MRVLITGATGLVGSHLTRLCHQNGIDVNYLTTSKDKIEKSDNYKGFYWNPEKEEIDGTCLHEVDAIFHLAGANIAKRWTQSYKKEIIDSRTKTAQLLFNTIQQLNVKTPHFISASGIAVYPDSLVNLYTEDERKVDSSFIGEVVVLWEEAADKFTELEMKVAKIRTGLVLAKEDGALPKMKAPIALNAGAAFGSGKQWQSWIHIEDLARLYLYVFENQLEGTYNAVAPNPVTNKELMEAIAAQNDKTIWLPNVPAVALKLALGEMSTVVLSSQRISCEKIQAEGFNFEYNNLPGALKNLI